jgi:uncharacterized protein (TIGR03437 family)
MSMLRIRVTFLSTFVFIVLASSLLAQAPAPANLVVTSATKSAVVLSWQAVSGASSYVVQRRTVAEAAYYVANNATTSDTTYTDKSFDPFTAYTYRVFAIVGGNPGFASSEVTAGPPPPGFSMVSTTPQAALTALRSGWYGQLVAMALDANEDPAIAFCDASTAFTANNFLTDVYFMGWDRAHRVWKAPVKIGTGNNIGNHTPGLAIAFDSSTNRFGVAYQSDMDNIQWVAFSSDGGATWTKQQIQAANAVLVEGCALKMANGQAFLVDSLDPGGVVYASGAQTATGPITWTGQRLPVLGNECYAKFDLALDSTGQPGVAFMYRDASASTDVVYFWRPPATTATKVTTSNGRNNMIGSPDIKLVFSGQNPRILLNMQRSDGGPYPYNTDLWSVASSDGGATWAAPVQLPSDGDTGLDTPITLAIGPQGQAAASASNPHGTTGQGMKCGWPKLSRTTDWVSWTMCNPGNSPAPQWIYYDYPSVAYASNGKLYFAFQNANKGDNRDLPILGVMLWREAPQASNLAPPQVSEGGVINNASHAVGKPLAPGSIIEIYGSNQGSGAALVGNLPLNTVMGAGQNPSVVTSVAINGVPAPLYYVSAGQVNAQVPFATPAGDAYVTVTVNDSLSQAIRFQSGAYAPGIYAVINANGSLNPAGGSAKPGDYLTVYATGLGAVGNPPLDGWPALANPLSNTQGTVTATIGGQPATVAFAGLTPGNVGLYQVNVRVPSLAAGNYPLVISEGAVASNSVTISVAAP